MLALHEKIGIVSSNNLDKLQADLSYYGFNYKQITGCYQGVLETSCLVVCANPQDEVNLNQLACNHKQECWLFSDRDRSSYLHYTDGRPDEYIGRLVNVPDWELNSLDNYSIVDGKIWTTKR